MRGNDEAGWGAGSHVSVSHRSIRGGGSPCSCSQTGINKQHGHECSVLLLGVEPLSNLVGVGTRTGSLWKVPGFGKVEQSGRSWNKFPIPAATTPGSSREGLSILYVQ